MFCAFVPDEVVELDAIVVVCDVTGPVDEEITGSSVDDAACGMSCAVDGEELVELGVVPVVCDTVVVGAMIPRA